MLQSQLRRVEINARCRRAAVKRVAQDRETHIGGMDPDLMRPPSQRLRFNYLVATDIAHSTSAFGLRTFLLHVPSSNESKPRLCRLPAGV